MYTSIKWKQEWHIFPIGAKYIYYKELKRYASIFAQESFNYN